MRDLVRHEQRHALGLVLPELPHDSTSLASHPKPSETSAAHLVGEAATVKRRRICTFPVGRCPVGCVPVRSQHERLGGGRPPGRRMSDGGRALTESATRSGGWSIVTLPRRRTHAPRWRPRRCPPTSFANTCAAARGRGSTRPSSRCGSVTSRSAPPTSTSTPIAVRIHRAERAAQLVAGRDVLA